MIKKYLGRIIYYLAWPLAWLLARNTRRSRVLIICKNEILLTKSFISPSNRWSLPGGGVKKSEADKVCASRELREELGIVVDPTNLRELGEIADKDHGIPYTAAILALPCDKSRKFKKGHEIIEFAWFPIKKLPANRKPLVDQAILLAKQG